MVGCLDTRQERT